MKGDAAEESNSDEREADAAMERYARDGDPHAFATLIDLLQPRLLGYLKRQLRGASDAEDLLQVCLLKLHQHRGKFAPGARVLPYAFAIARRLLIDKLRGDHRERRREDGLRHCATSSPTLPDAAVASRQTLARIEDALLRIPAEQREAFELTTFDGMSLELAAAVTDTRPTTIKMRTHYARAALRECLGKDAEDLFHD